MIPMGTKAYLGDLDAELLGAQESYGFTRTRYSTHKPPMTGNGNHTTYI